MMSVQAELLRKLQRRNEGIDDEVTGNQILSPTLAAFVRNKDKPLRREETDDENSPKFISHGRRNFTIDRKCGVARMNNLLEQVNGKKASDTTGNENCNVKSNGEIKMPVLKPVIHEPVSNGKNNVQATNGEIKMPTLRLVDQESVSNANNDVHATNGELKMPVLKPVMPVTVIEIKPDNQYQLSSQITPPPPLPPLRLPSSFYRDISSDEASSSSMPSSNFTSPSPSPLCHFNKSQSTENLGEIHKSENESTSSSPLMFDRSKSLQTTPNSSESNLSEKSETNVAVKRQVQRFRSNASTLPRKSEKLMMSHGKPNFVINKHSTMKPMKNKEKSPPVSDEFAIKVQELRKNFDSQSNGEATNNSTIKNSNSFRQIQNSTSTVSSSPQQLPITTPPKLAIKPHFITQFNQPQSPTKFEQHTRPTLKSPVIKSVNTTFNSNSIPVSPVPQKHRSEIQIPMINHTRSTSSPVPVPVAPSNIPSSSAAAANDDGPNFEKKVSVSFAKDLSSAPNRYPDTAVIKKQIPVATKQNHDYMADRNVILKELLSEDLLLKDIKFSIDPNNTNDITIDLKIGVNLAAQKN